MLTASKNHSYTNYDRFNEFENFKFFIEIQHILESSGLGTDSLN